MSCLALLTVLLAPSQSGEEERFTLPNGLDVYLRRLSHHDIVVTGIAYRAGALDEPDGRHGLAHLVEHLVFRGATPSYSVGEAETRFKEHGPYHVEGQDSNAETMHDFTYYYSIQPSSQFEAALQIEAERMRGVRITPGLLEQEVPKILTEIRQVSETPYAVAFNRLLALTYEKTGYRFPKVGVEADVRTLTAEDALAFYRTFYRPDRAVLVLYGNVPDGARALVEKHFGAIGNPPEKVSDPPAEPQAAAGTRERLDFPRMLPQVMMSFQSAEPETREKAALLVIAGELRTRFSRHSGVAGRTVETDVSDDFRTRGRSSFQIRLGLAAGANPETTADEALDVIAGLAANPPEAKRIASRVKQIRTELHANDVFPLLLLAKDREQYLRVLVQTAINRLWREIPGRDRVPRLLEELEKVTPEDVKAAAEKYLSKDRANVLIIRPR